MEIYQKIADAKTKGDLKEIEGELSDRFGKLHSQVLDILTLAEAKLIAESKEIIRITLKKGILGIDFDPEKDIGKKEIEKIRKKLNYPLEFSVKGGLRITVRPDKEENQAGFVKKVLQKI